MRASPIPRLVLRSTFLLALLVAGTPSEVLGDEPPPICPCTECHPCACIAHELSRTPHVCRVWNDQMNGR